MARTTLKELVDAASADEVTALREALASPPAPGAPARTVLAPEALRALRARHGAARKRIDVDRLALVQAVESAGAELDRARAALVTLDAEAGWELDAVRGEAFAGRPVEVDEAAAALREEAAGLAANPAPGAPGESAQARVMALHGLADLLTVRASEAAFSTGEDVAAFVADERGNLPADKE